jgi:hypothetical protein
MNRTIFNLSLLLLLTWCGGCIFDTESQGAIPNGTYRYKLDTIAGIRSVSDWSLVFEYSYVTITKTNTSWGRDMDDPWRIFEKCIYKEKNRYYIENETMKYTKGKSGSICEVSSENEDTARIVALTEKMVKPDKPVYYFDENKIKVNGDTLHVYLRDESGLSTSSGKWATFVKEKI